MQFQRTLAFRALLPIAAFAILLLAAMASFALFAIEHFVKEQGARDLRLRAMTVRQIADDNYGGLRRHGRADSEVAVREARVDTLLTIEDYSRIHGLQVSIYDRVSARTTVFGEIDLGREGAVSASREIRRFERRGREFQTLSVGFDPWEWEITLTEPTEGFSALRQELLRGAAMTLAVLIVGAGIFVFMLHRFIHRPVERIIHGLQNGEPPGYTGIAEFAFISDAIATMMASVREKAGKLERYQNHLEHLVAERTAELTRANAELNSLNVELADTHSQLLHAEKMAAVGQLAAGVAHEMNNPLGFVTSNLTSLKRYQENLLALVDAYDERLAHRGSAEDMAAIAALRKDREFDYIRNDVADLLRDCNEGLARMQRIVSDLKDFSRVGEEQWQSVDLHRGLDSTLSVVGSEIRGKAEVVRDYGLLPTIDGLPGQLNQAFMNLLMNAAQAIPERGRITVRTRVADDHVVVEVADTGVGIPPENLSRIFEPFFTTKPVGQGTGLGLSIVYGIVKRHGGHIEVESQAGAGACFRVLLPIRQASAQAGAGYQADQIG